MPQIIEAPDTDDSESLVEGQGNDADNTPAGAGSDDTPDTDWKAEATRLQTQIRELETYQARFKGLQPVHQREVESHKETRNRLLQLEAELAQAKISMLPEEQRPYAQWAAQLDLQNKQQQVVRETEQAGLLQILQNAVLTEQRSKALELSQKYGVPQEKLLKRNFNGPEEMEDFAKDLADMRRSTAKKAEQQQRKAADADKFGGGSGGPSAPMKQPETDEEAIAFMKAILSQRN